MYTYVCICIYTLKYVRVYMLPRLFAYKCLYKSRVLGAPMPTNMYIYRLFAYRPVYIWLSYNIIIDIPLRVAHRVFWTDRWLAENLKGDNAESST